MRHDACATCEAVTRGQGAQREVGVLAVGAPEALVEATELAQDGATVGHVGGRPRSSLEAGDVALPVRRSPVDGSRHDDAALAGGDVVVEVEVVGERRGSTRRSGTTSSSRNAIHVARDARHPTLRAAAGPRATGGEDGDVERPDVDGQRADGVASIVDDQHATGELLVAECPSSVRSDGRPMVGTTTSTSAVRSDGRLRPTGGHARRGDIVLLTVNLEDDTIDPSPAVSALRSVGDAADYPRREGSKRGRHPPRRAHGQFGLHTIGRTSMGMDADPVGNWHRAGSGPTPGCGLFSGACRRQTSLDKDALLRRHGLQVTAQRLAVLRAVSERPHSAADDICTVVRAEIGAISRQAVYDALAVAHRQGRPPAHPARWIAGPLRGSRR